MNQSKKDYFKSLPKKLMAAGVLLFSEQNKLLILHPTYKDRWEIAGGIIEQNESPRAAAAREVREEIGLPIISKQLLVVDYWSTVGEKPENIQWIFYGGVLPPAQLDAITLQEDEIGSYEFIGVKTEKEREWIVKRPRVGKRALTALDALVQGAPLYLENGQIV
jgi:8-oxo-dGTP diphosphatase